VTTKYSVFVVPHTHWDRAWYVPFEEFRLRLVRMIDRLLNTLQKDPAFTCFVLDGQAVVLDDYLQIRPQAAEKLRSLIKAKRLYVGPWYVLPDEFLVSPEALIRNLLYGMKVSQSFGRSMKVGYVPDSFGHVAQLPQILQGFGLDSFIFFRGLEQEATKLDLEFLWRSPDGSTVLASRQHPFYGNGTHLGYVTNWGDTEVMVQSFKDAVEKIDKSCKNLLELTKSRVLLLGNGIDQADHQQDLPRLLKRLAGKFPQYSFRIASFEDYIGALRRDLNGTKLKTHDGELIYRYGDLLGGVYSSRMYMKMQNQQCEDLLEKWTEPVAAAAWLTGCAPYPQDEIAYAWKELLKTHPHDDVCGSSIDQVHKEGVVRMDAVDQVGRMLHRTALRTLALNTDRSHQAGAPIMLFNSLAAPRKEVTRIAVDLCPITESWKSFQLFDENGREIPYQLLSSERVHWWEAVKPFDVLRHRCELEIDLPGMGYRTIYAREGTPTTPKQTIRLTDKSFENAFYKLSIKDNGALTLKDKKTRCRYDNLLVFEDTEDCGDEYNWSYLAEGSETITTEASRPKITCIHNGPLSATWRITHALKVPESLRSDRKGRSKKKTTLTIVSDITCRAGSPRIDVTTRVSNNVKDHRLRALFPTEIAADTVQVDGHFAILDRALKHPAPKKTSPYGCPLPPYTTQHVLRFASLSGGRSGLAIINDGMPEFEAVCKGKTKTLAQTLFRAVGWLGRDDFPTRPYSASPMITAPEAQCLIPMEFRFAFMAHGGDWHPVMNEALRHNVDVCVTRSDIHGGTDLRQMGIKLEDERALQKYHPTPRTGSLPDRLQFLDLGTESLVLSAFKKCEWNENLIVRVYNPGSSPVKATMKFYKPIRRAWLTNLNEKRVKQLKTANTILPFLCGPFGICTFELEA
jgi:alpha-mannosidase